MSANLKEKIKYIVPVLLTLFLGCVILALKQMFPFGTDTIDYYDMAQQITAFYYHVYDMLHGTKAFFFDWYTALGVNMAMSTSGCSNLSLFNLFFLFVPRDMLLESLSIFQLLKMMCMTFTMYVYLHKTYRAPYYIETVLSAGYGFCGFVLVLYITNQWMDLAILFPLLMLALGKLLKTGKMRMFTVLLTLMLINSYYITFMVLIFIFLMVGLKLFSERLFEQKEKREQYHLLRLGLAVLLSLGISAFILVPQLMQTLASARFENENGGGLFSQYLSILKQTTPAYTTRWWTLLGLSFAAAVILTGLIRNRKNKKVTFLVCSAIFMMVLELFLESVNLLWHFGSYVQYPIRNGFMIYFVFAVSACFYAQQEAGGQEEYIGACENSESHPGHPSHPGIWTLVPGVCAAILIAAASICIYKNYPQLPVRTVFHVTAAFMAVSFAVYMALLLWKKGRYCYLSVFLITAEVLFYTFLLLGKPAFVTGYSEEPEQEGEYVRICNQLSDAFDLKPDYLARVKNPDESLNANYGLVLRRPAMSNWTHMISPGLQQGAAAWGYSWQFTRLLDAGGTAFSDALLGITDTISSIPQESALYGQADSAGICVDHITGEEETYYHYKNRYTLPWGMVIQKTSALDVKQEDMVSLQNAFYQMLSHDTDGVIASWMKDGSTVDDVYVSDYRTEKKDSIQTETLSVNVEGSAALYFSGCGGDREDKNTVILVNGEPIPVPSIKETDNSSYPAHFNNNAVCLGVFQNEEVSIEILMDLSLGEAFETQVSQLDLEKLSKLCDTYKDYDTGIHAGKNSLELTVQAKQAGEVLLLPLAADAGWEVTVNGRQGTAKAVAGLFSGILLDEGENAVSMKYLPSGMKGGTILSVFTLLLALLSVVVLNRKADRAGQMELRIERWLKPLYMTGWTAAVLIVYLIPIAAAGCCLIGILRGN